VAEGLARDVVSRVQQARRGAGLDVSDRIRLRWATDDADLAAAIERHRDYIATETLAEQVERGPAGEGEPAEVDGAQLGIVVEKV
jgi:isoleucyl-tRNA synthetase